MTRVFVTGGAGFIGSALIRHLLRQGGYHILNVDALTYAGNVAALEACADHADYRFVRADITDRATMAALLADFRPQIVTHLAAETHVDRSLDGPGAFVTTNVVGTYELLQAVLAYWRTLGQAEAAGFRFHHISTDEVFGALGPEGQFDETTPYDPRSPYSASKAGSDHLVSAWHHSFGLPVLVTNCSNNYGPWQFPEKLIPLTIAKCFAQSAIPVYGTGANVRDWLYVDDHVRALELVFARAQPGSRYMIGGSGERTNLEVVHTICAVMDRLHPRPDGSRHDQLIRFVTDRPGHDFRYAVNADRIRADLGWSPKATFEAAMAETVQWYLDHRDWWGPLVAADAAQRRGLGVAG